MGDDAFIQPDYRMLFEQAPGLYMVLDRDLRIVAATDAYLHATLTRREEIIGRYVFDVFPDNPNDPNADAVRNSSASFNRVLKTGQVDAMVIQRHDVRKPDGSGFETHYWSPINYPIFGPDGSVDYIMHRVEDVTEFVRLKEQSEEQTRLSGETQERLLQMEADLYARSREVAEANRRLKETNVESLEDAWAGRRLLDIMMENVPDGITIADAPDVTIRMVSRYGQEVLGGPHESMTAGEVAEQWKVYRADGVTPLPDDELPLVRAIKRGETVRNVEVVQVNEEGHRLTLLCNAAPIRDSAGNITGGIVAWRDITERKKAEQAFLSQRLLLETVINNIPVQIELMRGSDFRIVLINPAYQAIAPGKEMVGKTLDEVWPELDRDFVALCRKVLETGETYEAVDDPVDISQYPGGPTERRYFTWSLIPVDLPGGEGSGVLNIAMETTERKKAEERILRQSRVLEGINRVFHEALSAQTEEQLGEVCLAVAEEITGSRFGFIGEINERGLEDIAISNPGWDACRITMPEGHRKLPGNFKIHGLYGRVIRDGKSLCTNDPASHPDSIGLPPGHPPLTSFLGVPLIAEGKTIGVAAVANREGGYTQEQLEDLEALAPAIVQAFSRKKAEESLRESEARYRELVETANSAIIRWNSDGTLAFMNDFAQRFFGYSEDEVLGKPVSILVPPTESTGAGPTTLVRDILAHPDRYVNNVNENVRKNGSRVWMTWSNKAVTDAQGNVVEILAIGNDITDRKKAEEALQKALRDLEERSREIQEANEQLATANEELAVTNEELEVATEELRLEAEERKKVNQELREEQEHKLDFYRRTIEAATNGKLIVTERSEIEKIAGPALARWEIHSRHDIQVIRHRVEEHAQAAGIEGQRLGKLTVAVGEAVTNALKHARSGEVTFHRAEDFIIVVVSDRGPGIPAIKLPDVALRPGFSTAGTLGMGYKMMIRFADKVCLATGDEGTTVGIEMKLHPAEPSPNAGLMVEG